MGARPWLILAAMVLARIAFGYQYQTVASLAPELIAAYGLDYTSIGTLIGVFVAPGIVLALPLGLLGRRYGDRLIVGGGLALMTAGPLLGAVWADPVGIGAGRLLAGAGGVAMIVLQNKIISDWFSGRTFMAAIGLSVSAYPVGVSGAQIVLPWLAATSGTVAALVSGAVLVGITLVLFLASYRDSPSARVAPRRFSLPGRRECLLVLVGGLVWTAYTGCYSGFVSYVPSLMSVRGHSAWTAGAVMTIATWGSIPATLAGGALGARFGNLRVLLFGTVAMALGCAGMGFTAWPLASAVLFGVLGSAQPSVIMAAGTLSSRPENRAVGMGIFYTTYYAGNALAPALCGHAADLAGGPGGALYAAAAIGLLAIPLWLLHAHLAAAGPSRQRAVFRRD
jgi:MFS family permease